MNALNRLTLTAICAAATALAVGCETAPRNQGTSGYRMDPTHDSEAELGSLDLRSADLVAATDKMAMDMAQRLDISNRDNPPRIFFGEIENETSRPNRDYQIFLNRLRTLLGVAGTRHGLDIRRERQFVEKQRAREYGDKQPDRAPSAYRSEAEYVLTCVVSDLPSGGTNYYLLEYQLVQLVDVAESGPDAGPGAIVWTNFYEVKYQ